MPPTLVASTVVESAASAGASLFFPPQAVRHARQTAAMKYFFIVVSVAIKFLLAKEQKRGDMNKKTAGKLSAARSSAAFIFLAGRDTH